MIRSPGKFELQFWASNSSGSSAIQAVPFELVDEKMTRDTAPSGMGMANSDPGNGSNGLQ
jgi:hypothetical protein